MTNYGPPERVYVEKEWYDGPRAGIADIGGAPHRFISPFLETRDDDPDIFLVWPVDQIQLELEIEQSAIFVEWNSRYEAGEAGTDSHPEHGGVNARWDEIEILLRSARTEVPPTARRALAQMVSTGTGRYSVNGPAYQLSWLLL
jgi:hypothetical protein